VKRGPAGLDNDAKLGQGRPSRSRHAVKISLQGERRELAVTLTGREGVSTGREPPSQQEEGKISHSLKKDGNRLVSRT